MKLKYLLLIVFFLCSGINAHAQIVISDIPTENIRFYFGNNCFVYTPGMSDNKIIEQLKTQKLAYTYNKSNKTFSIKNYSLNKKTMTEEMIISSSIVSYKAVIHNNEYNNYRITFKDKGLIFFKMNNCKFLKSTFSNNVLCDRFEVLKPYSKFFEMTLTKTFYKEVLTFDLPKPKK